MKISRQIIQRHNTDHVVIAFGYLSEKMHKLFKRNIFPEVKLESQRLIDLIINNPTLQARKKVDQLLQLAIHKEINPELKVKINFEYKSLKKENIIVVVSGGNVDSEMFTRALSSKSFSK